MTAIPVHVITGFLGSGKTTLLAALLRDPDFRDTAVIVNEFGEIALDHHLLEASEEEIVALPGGCLCCEVRGDLVRTLADLLARRRAGEIAPFRRVVVETTGLAEPAPILHALMTDAALSGQVEIASVVATVDAVNGAATLEAHAESTRQVALADSLVLTKGDLAPAGLPDLRARLRALNPSAAMLEAVGGDIGAERLFASPDRANRDPGRWLAADAHRHHHHGDGIESFSLVREAPIPAALLSLFLETLSDNCGRDLLRLKGILNIRENPEQPAIVHGVQHVLYPLAWLDAWPDEDRSSRLVFITQGVPGDWIALLLDMLADEVAALEARPSG